MCVCVSVSVCVCVCVCVCFVWSALADDWPVRRAWFGVDRSVRGGHFVDCESRRRCVSTPTNKILPTNDNNYSRTEGMAGGGGLPQLVTFLFCFGFLFWVLRLWFVLFVFFAVPDITAISDRPDSRTVGRNGGCGSSSERRVGVATIASIDERYALDACLSAAEITTQAQAGRRRRAKIPFQTK